MYPNGDYFDQKPVKQGNTNDNMFHNRNGSLAGNMPNGSRNNDFGRPNMNN